MERLTHQKQKGTKMKVTFDMNGEKHVIEDLNNIAVTYDDMIYEGVLMTAINQGMIAETDDVEFVINVEVIKR